MKRSAFKRKATVPMKRGKLKRQSKQPISKIQRKLWELCRKVALKKFVNKDGTIDCYTCDAQNLQGSNCQLGHMMAKASLGAYLKYDMRLLRWQCARCNLFFGGMGAEFYRRMMIEVGPTAMNELLEDRRVSVKAYDHYVKLIGEYEKLV